MGLVLTFSFYKCRNCNSERLNNLLKAACSLVRCRNTKPLTFTEISNNSLWIISPKRADYFPQSNMFTELNVCC